jgi:hypothetical protein
MHESGVEVGFLDYIAGGFYPTYLAEVLIFGLSHE